MHTIKSLQPNDEYELLLEFENGNKKLFNLKPYLLLPVFQILKDKSVFKKVTNHKYFIEWQPHEIDLSADTLWHESTFINAQLTQ